MTSDSPNQEDAFRHVLAHRTMLQAYVHAIVRDPVLAEDTFSDVTLEIVRSWPRFDPTRAFEPWARGLARRVALANLRKHKRPLVTLDEAVLESIGAELDQFGRESDNEAACAGLHRCLKKLTPANQTLVRMRYFDGLSYDEIAQAVHCEPNALYVAFNRIHASLFRCVRLQQGGA